ncbi:2-keto-4-pentenoate hydratase [Labrys okinawensis]|uniref:2-keto-4-pentenoate hydratase n=1 Tax=Labrys okinawensis TaxID=346911 RepID=UPI0039BD21E4
MPSIAQRFHAARRDARPLPAFPGTLPETLAEAYAVQEEAISLWPDAVAGWKVASIHPDLRERFLAGRLAGPVFSKGVYRVAPGAIAQVPVIRDGFIAVETEIGLVVGADIAPRPAPWTLAELLPHFASAHVAMEIAGSPLPTINDIGPMAVISDFGNNTAIAIGAEISGWKSGAFEELKTQMLIGGTLIGEGAAVGANGGPLDACLFLVNHLATRGRGLAKGDVISAGATTGVHPLEIGQVAEAFCVGIPPLAIRIGERTAV